MKNISLSFGGGGAKAICYLGFLRALKEADIKIDHLFAYSGGTIILCFIASGMSDDEIIEKYSKFKFSDFLNLNIKQSFYSNGKIEKYLNKISKNANILHAIPR